MSERPSSEDRHMRTAFLWAERGTCSRISGTGQRMQVGAVITSWDMTEVFAIGFNGNAHGLPNKCDTDIPGACGCFLPNTLVTAASVKRAYRRRYVGDVLRVITTRGEFTATPNHPVLTAGRGWIAAERLAEGDHLFHARGDQHVSTRTPNDHNGVPIEEVFETLRVSGRMVRSVGARHQFHGDGLIDEDVDIVAVDSCLTSDAESRLFEPGGEPFFPRALQDQTLFGRPGTGSLSLIDGAAGDSLSARGVSHDGVGTSLVQSKSHHIAAYSERGSDLMDCLPSQVAVNDVRRQFEHRLAFMPAKVLGHLAKNTASPEAVLDSRVRDSHGVRESKDGLSGLVAPDKIVHIERYGWSGHVFNLETSSGWYYAGSGGNIAQNCIHAEENAVIKCGRRPEAKFVFTTHLPCVACAKRIIQLKGVVKVFWAIPYRIETSLELLKSVGIENERLIIDV